MLYGLLKFALSYATRKYFVQINVLNEDNIPKDKPVILLPNHRSAFMDPIVIATQIKQVTYFLVRGESFNNPTMVKVFNRIKMIPIYRKEYDPDKTGQNKDIFKYCHQLMEKKGCLMIFPEGICQTKYILAPLKSGAARIALEAEAKNNFELDIHVVPIGINYSNPHRFRGNLTIDVGEPIKPADFKTSYNNNSWEAVNELTAAIEKELLQRIITVEDQEQIRTVAHIENLFVGKTGNLPFESSDWHQTRKGINEFIEKQKANDATGFKAFENKLKTYVGTLQGLGVEKNVSLINQSSSSIGKRIAVKLILLIVGYPLYVVSYLMHFIPFKLTRFLSLKFVRRVDFMGSVALALGLLMFTIFGIGETIIFHKLIQVWWLTVIFFLIWPTLGLFAYGYLAEWVKLREAFKWMRGGAKKTTLLRHIKSEQSQLIDYLSLANQS
ncbi:MAG: glycerol-3-phosphate O-acyltransferase/dihydroxyacetone phosphate acyltransferase [Bacteroidia bacterium]|jgi:glycerol-3-phosphate O-acyltransferase/dihydroxyacetone phosphate acyltransferase